MKVRCKYLIELTLLIGVIFCALSAIGKAAEQGVWIHIDGWPEIRVGSYDRGTGWSTYYDDDEHFEANCKVTWVVIGFNYDSKIAFYFTHSNAKQVRIEAKISIGGSFKVYVEYTTGNPVYLGSFFSGSTVHYFNLDQNKLVDCIVLQYVTKWLIYYTFPSVDTDICQIEAL